jgi:carboxylate-amine ligase
VDILEGMSSSATEPARPAARRVGRGQAFDEAREESGAPRPHYRALLGQLADRDLQALERRVADDLAERGVVFGGAGQDWPFSVDPVPRLITAAEWEELAVGLEQRLRALNAFLADAYGERAIVEAGIVPASVLDRAAYYERALVGTEVFERAAPIAVAGLDVVRDTDGTFLVLEDNVRTPSGLAYAVAARAAVEAHHPHGPERVPLEGAFALLGEALRAAAPDGRDEPCVVVLSDGPRNVAWYEHRTIAAHLDLPVVALQDLHARADGLYARLPSGLRRVDVLYRRTDEDRLVDDRGELTPVGSVLLEPWKRGQIGLVNAFGTGVADDKLTHAYVEDMVRFYLGEEPLVGSVPTYDLAHDERRGELLKRLGDLVVKPRAASGGHGILIGPRASPHARATMAAAVRTAPEAFIAQETVWLSCHPTVVDGALEGRHVDLRAFVFSLPERVATLPGGLTRVARERGQLIVNSSQQGGGKDTWVLGS